MNTQDGVVRGRSHSGNRPFNSRLVDFVDGLDVRFTRLLRFGLG